jgi:16S rRNA (uracil1498-N3)-methyltransferase
MTHIRLLIPGELRTDSELELDAERAHYIGRVLRLKPGDRLSVFNGDHGEFDARVLRMAKNSAVLLAGESRPTATESPLRVQLVQGISRGERMDFVVQKATELGVKRISPVFTEHGVVRLDDERAAKRREHWQRVVESACEQSGRIRPPLVDRPVTLKQFLGARPAATDVDLILKPGAAQPLASIAAPQTKICLLVGPEGGFSGGEYGDAEVAGFGAVSLGPRVLRTETAALAAIAILQAAWGDLAGR